jgi:lipopolysaccharide biosynthesis glycosyltransferase
MKLHDIEDNIKVEVQDTNALVLVCAADDKYAMPLSVAVRSALENINKKRDVILFIIDGGIKIHNKNKILNSLTSEKCNVKFIPKPNALLKDIEETHLYCEANNITLNNYVSLACYYRLLIPELLPKNLKKVIYLDSDLIVRGDLEDLWQIDLEENYVLAAQDIWIRFISAPEGLLNYKELGMASGSKYFNSGVLVINLEKWRMDKIAIKAIQYIKENSKYIRYHDQDVLNAILGGKWGELDPRWNCQNTIRSYSSWKESPFSEEIYDNLIHDPYIIHYVTRLKPWISRHTPFKEYFFKYVDMTEWSGWRLTIFRQLWLKLIETIR